MHVYGHPEVLGAMAPDVVRGAFVTFYFHSIGVTFGVYMRSAHGVKRDAAGVPSPEVTGMVRAQRAAKSWESG